MKNLENAFIKNKRQGLNTMLLILTVVVVFVSHYFSVALANNENRGGGQCVAMSDGSYRFLDMLDPSDFNKTGPNGEPPVHPIDRKANDHLWEKNRYVKKSLYSDEEVFPNLRSGRTIKTDHYPYVAKNSYEPAYEILKNYQSMPVVKEILKLQSNKTESFFVEFRLPQSNDQASPTIDANFQEPCAIYANGVFIISKRIFDLLPPKDKAALFVHEALRESNYLNFTNNKLETKEIETATRYFMGLPELKDANLNGILTKLSVDPSCVRKSALSSPFSDLHMDNVWKRIERKSELEFLGVSNDCVLFDITEKKFHNKCFHKKNLHVQFRKAFCDARDEITTDLKSTDIDRFCEASSNDIGFNAHMHNILHMTLNIYWKKKCNGYYEYKCSQQVAKIREVVKEMEMQRSKAWYYRECIRFDDKEAHFIWDCKN